MKNFCIKAIRVPNATQEIELLEGTTLQEFLTTMGWELRENEVAGVNGLIASPNQILKEGDRVILSMGAYGEVPTPRIKNVERFLKKRGFFEVKGEGKGDHRKFSNVEGRILTLNPAKRDRKQLDFGSAKEMAKFFGLTPEELYLEIK